MEHPNEEVELGVIYLRVSSFFNVLASHMFISTCLSFFNRAHMNVVPRSTMNTNGETEN